MTTTEHLARIRARCVELLEIASKRTQGRWKTHGNHPYVTYGKHDFCICGTNASGSLASDDYVNNAAFIASCAGPAEAGWRATIAAIDYCLGVMHMGVPEELVESIIAAWPEELL